MIAVATEHKELKVILKLSFLTTIVQLLTLV